LNSSDFFLFLISSNPSNCQTSYQRRLLVTRSGRKIKGRGPRRYRTPSRSRSRDRFRRSETPPHWRQEMQRAQRMRVSSGERWIKGDKYLLIFCHHSDLAQVSSYRVIFTNCRIYSTALIIAYINIIKHS
uniref:Peptidylprolyl isomerase G n=1 Tax=Pseudonaja textilis TaxID=8673 RepID=A0A670XPZ9_PSETE